MTQVSRSLRKTAAISCISITCCTSQAAVDRALEPNTLSLSFDPMYSAFDGVREYTLPVTLKAGAYDPTSTDPVDLTTLRWTVDKKFALQQEYPALPGGVLLTTRSAGVTIVTAVATSKSGRRLQGTATLHITQADPAEWDLGETRYHNNVPLMFESSETSVFESDGFSFPPDASCANCHNADMLGLGVSIEHTPQQTAGYSDDELIKIFSMGAKPKGEFHSPIFAGEPTAFSERAYKEMHTWDIAPEVQRGIVYKLRSITPKPQEQIDYERLLEDFDDAEDAASAAAQSSASSSDPGEPAPAGSGG